MLQTHGRPAAVIALLMLCCFAGSGGAQTPPAPPASEPPAAGPPPAAAPPAPALPQSLTVLVVDVQALLQNAKAAKMIRSQIEAKRAEYAKEISHQDEILRQERDTLQRQQASLSPEALNQKGRDFQQKVNDLDRNVQSKRQALEKSYNDTIEKVQATLLKIIEQIAKDRKANLVLQRSQLVLFDQVFDVTDEVLQKLDEQLPTLTVEFVAPVASAGSAATPASATEPGQPAPAPAPVPTKPKKK